MGVFVLGYGFFANFNQQSDTALVQVQQNIEQTKIQQCNVGYNPGFDLHNPAILNDAQSSSMKYVVTIIKDRNDTPKLIEFIKSAQSRNITPIVRMCDAVTDCTSLARPESTAQMINEINSSLTTEKYVFIAGPNEPISERWIEWPRKAEARAIGDITLQEHRAIGKEYMSEVGKYVKNVVANVQDKSKVELLGAAFNLDYQGGSDGELMRSYLSGLGDGANQLDGFGGNIYNISSRNSSGSFYAVERYKRAASFLPKPITYITEFGPLDTTPDSSDLAESYNALKSQPGIKSISFFVPFAGRGNTAFSRHNIDMNLFRQITGCSGSSSTLPGITPTPITSQPQSSRVDLKVAKLHVPYAPYYQDNDTDMKSCQRVGTTKPNLGGTIKLKRQGDVYVGYKLVTADVYLPQFGHIGATENHTIENSSTNDGEFRKVVVSPYDPICLTLTNTLSWQNKITTHEHPGLLEFHSNGQKQLDMAIPKLGNAIACLNLINYSQNTSSNAYDIDDFVGFSTDYMTLVEREKAYDSSYGLIYSKVANRPTSFFERVRNIFGSQNEINPVRDTLPGEPIVEYKDQSYCIDTATPVNEINTSSAQPSDSVSTGEQIAMLERVEVRCGDPKSKNGLQILGDPCAQAVEISAVLDLGTIDQISIPGAQTGYDNFYLALLSKSEAHGKHIVDQSNRGIEVTAQLKVYDASNLTDTLTNYTYTDDTSQTGKKDASYAIKYQIIQDTVGLNLATNTATTTNQIEYKYILPFDLADYMVKYHYNFGVSEQSNDYFVETNPNVKK